MFTKLSIPLLLFIIGSNYIEASEPESFEVTISGQLFEKLDPKTKLSFWHPCVKPDKWINCPVGNLPIKLPAETFQGSYCYVNFWSPEVGLIMSVMLSWDLFDKPRKIDIKLDSPNPFVRPTSFGWNRDLFYSAPITRRMSYRDLPYWDEDIGRLTTSKPPVVKVIRVADGKILFNAPMGMGCTASKWYVSIRKVLRDLEDKTKLRFVVDYDSNGLFEKKTATYDFTYSESLHGR